MNEWISVKDQLPTENEWILISSSRLNYVEMGVYMARREGNKEFKDPDRGYFIYPQVTHWMPLPKPPMNHD